VKLPEEHQRKYWNEQELRELENLYNQHFPNNVPVEKLEEFGRKTNRTLCSVQTKIQKLKKEFQKKQEELAMENLRTKCNPGANVVNKRYEIPLEKNDKNIIKSFF